MINSTVKQLFSVSKFTLVIVCFPFVLLLVASAPSGPTNVSTTHPVLVKADSLRPGMEAPPFVMRDLLTGEPTFLREYTGKTLRESWKKRQRFAVVLSFWATWCQPCKIEIPLLTKMADDFKGQPVKIFLINTLEQEPSTEDTVLATYKSRKYTLPCLLDASSRFAGQYTVRGLPMIVVIDKFGIVRKVNRGFHENFDIEIADLLKELAKEDSPGIKH